jgi:cation:H+ antiporter
VQNEHDLIVSNVLDSGVFNTLAVLGFADRSRIINRVDGGILMPVYVSYTGYLLTTTG